VRFNPSFKFGQALLLKIELGWGENYQTTIPSNLPLQLFFMLMASCEWSATISLFGWRKAKVTIKSAETFGPLVKHASCLPWVPECPAIRDFHWDAHLLSRGSTHSATSKGAQCILGTDREENVFLRSSWRWTATLSILPTYGPLNLYKQSFFSSHESLDEGKCIWLWFVLYGGFLTIWTWIQQS